MIKNINEGMVEGICVVFENCEFVYIPVEYIHNLDVKGIRRDKCLSGFGDDFRMRDTTISMYVDFTVREYGDTKESLDKSTLFSSKQDQYDGYSRLYHSQDITSIEYIYTNGKKEQLYIDYSLDAEGSEPNEYQQNMPVITKEVPRGVRIRVARPKTIQKYQTQTATKTECNKESVGDKAKQPVRVNETDIEGYSDMFKNVGVTVPADLGSKTKEVSVG